MKYLFAAATFLGSYFDTFPEFRNRHGALLPEIAIVGKSNVGKSSLINHLLRHKKLARVSATPGKTQTINFFNVDDQLIVTDLPGYGFAKRAKVLRESWAGAIDNYLKNRPSLKLVFLLVDSRRGVSEEDITFISWANHYKKPLLLIFTKSDTLSSHDPKPTPPPGLNAISYSIRDAHGRKMVCSEINKRL